MGNYARSVIEAGPAGRDARATERISPAIALRKIYLTPGEIPKGPRRKNSAVERRGQSSGIGRYQLVPVTSENAFAASVARAIASEARKFPAK